MRLASGRTQTFAAQLNKAEESAQYDPDARAGKAARKTDAYPSTSAPADAKTKRARPAAGPSA
ncbi:MAG: hypothetical protein CVV09_01540 [Gammaproteobacteria bacterium HGW-Gammaproteobacteria-13]|nr:MAG: hypothetical protein CVV09_01540 [Gammaproteobacteria bacterium HGW-Gammaproteobacteria-13]